MRIVDIITKKRDGGELSDEEIERWDELLEPLVDEWVAEIEGMGLPAQEFLDRLYELRDEHAGEHG